jgi:hypothetical protein
MTRLINVLTVVATFILSSGCGSGIKNDANTNDINADSTAVVKVDNHVVCTEQEQTTYDKDLEENLTSNVKECKFRDYKSIQTSYMNPRNGHESYDYQLFKMINDKYAPVKNAELFKNNKEELLTLINNRMREVINRHYGEEGGSDCLEGNYSPDKKFSYDEMGITFEEGKIIIHISLELIDACAAFDQNTVELNLEEVEKYLN